jgi:hypothetical protein
VLAFVGVLAPSLVLAAQVAPVPEVIVDRLNNPSGVAIQPETGDVFVADSGALRIVRIVEGRIEPVITGFTRDAYGKSPIYDIGPLGLLFLDKDTLVVGGGGKPDGEEMLRVYKIPAADKPAISADQTHGTAMMLSAKGDLVGEGNFYALAQGKQGIYVTCNGDDEKGWISLAKLEGGKLASFERKIATKEKIKFNAPVAITISPEKQIVVGQMGAITQVGDSQLSFYDEDGELLDNFATDLNDITGLAYGPQHKRLFATDFNWLNTDKGGLYKLIAIQDNYEKCKAQELLKLKKPTALAFHPNGDLYITLAGNMSEGARKPDGKLIVIKGLDIDPNE